MSISAGRWWAISALALIFFDILVTPAGPWQFTFFFYRIREMESLFFNFRGMSEYNRVSANFQLCIRGSGLFGRNREEAGFIPHGVDSIRTNDVRPILRHPLLLYSGKVPVLFKVFTILVKCINSTMSSYTYDTFRHSRVIFCDYTKRFPRGLHGTLEPKGAQSDFLVGNVFWALEGPIAVQEGLVITPG